MNRNGRNLLLAAMAAAMLWALPRMLYPMELLGLEFAFEAM